MTTIRKRARKYRKKGDKYCGDFQAGKKEKLEKIRRKEAMK